MLFSIIILNITAKIARIKIGVITKTYNNVHKKLEVIDAYVIWRKSYRKCTINYFINKFI